MKTTKASKPVRFIASVILVPTVIRTAVQDTKDSYKNFLNAIEEETQRRIDEVEAITAVKPLPTTLAE